METLLKIDKQDKNLILIDYLGRQFLLKIFKCIGEEEFEEEIKKHRVSAPRDIQIALIPVSMIKTIYQLIQGALIDEIHVTDLRVKNPDLRLALLITGYTQINKFVEAVVKEYSSLREYYVILKCRNIVQCDRYNPPANCQAIGVESLDESIEYAVKNLKRVLSMIT
jgi:hypothetical protein